MQIKLNENIKKYRKSMNLTQEELAEAFGVTVGAVSKWESGSNVPDILTLMQLADFFSISVDVLLGYSMSSKNVKDISDRLEALLHEDKYDEVIAEAEKALVRYPGNFKILTRCAGVYHVVSGVKDSKEYRNKAIELYESSLRYVSQSDKPDQESFSIRFQIATLNGRDNPAKSLEEFEKINYLGIADNNIANILRMMGKPEEAMETYTKVLVSILVKTSQFSTEMFMTLVAMDNTKAYKEACEIMDWYMTIVDATSTDRSKNSYLSKMKIMGLVLKSLVLSSLKKYDEMRTCIDTAFEIAKEYDKNPSNDFSGKIKFWHGGKDDHISLYDEFGVGAVAGIDNLFSIGPKFLPPKVIKKMGKALEYWNSVKQGD
ncbi:helix-turn-helix domain-containing protein [Butyrivibrio proteoclasticus]|uniref:helix-turn-helix domain-containing protein n=1 Tax=Butyrivibrio proteoclasticus TaxID=43305 RepID=UPI000688186A|nr:helix-turn-helix transcriptional regulator [Butyrivibrio proteoclasticus]